MLRTTYLVASSRGYGYLECRDSTSLLLSRMAVPVLYFMAKRHERAGSASLSAPMEAAS
jgi:hypothetical protein